MVRNSVELRLDSAKLLAARRLVEAFPAADETIVTVEVVRLEEIELAVSDLGKTNALTVPPLVGVPGR